jgi:geranylgeranyl diphosphate synthase type II
MISEYKKILENELERYFQGRSGLIWEAMSYSTLLPSKKLRAILCLEACRMVSGSWEQALPTACAIEMLQTQSLIHDDLPCMDNDDMRRGKPSNHKVFGEAIATLAGDALISLGAQIIIEDTKNVPPETVLEVVRQYLETAGVFGIVGGQSADILAEGKNVSFEELKNIHKYKTSVFFEFALRAGALLGGASASELDAIQKFGENFGLAFQICDDILDEISSTEEMGKTIGKDRTAQKATYVSLFGLDESKKKLEELIFKSCDILKFGDINSATLEDIVKSILTKAGV